MSSARIKTLTKKFCLSPSLLPALICRFSLWVPEEHLLFCKKNQLPLCPAQTGCVQGAQTRWKERKKTPEFTKAAFTLVQKPNGPFLMGWGTSSQLSQPQEAFLLPSCTYGTFPRPVPSRRAHGVAPWGAGSGGNLVQNTPVCACVCEPN